MLIHKGRAVYCDGRSAADACCSRQRSGARV